MREWILVDFDSCPECGTDAEILTDSDDPELFYDGDQARCCECHYPGTFSLGDNTGYINWEDDPDYKHVHRLEKQEAAHFPAHTNELPSTGTTENQ